MEYTRIAFSERWLCLQDLDGEMWKDITGYEGLYQISNLGRVKSLPKMVCRCNYSKLQNAMIKRQNITGKDGKTYLGVHLYKNGKRVCLKVHKLVALHFLNNNGLPCVNHINEDKFDNRVENLEWCTYSYNNTYNNLKERQHHNKLNPKAISYPVLQYSENGLFIAQYPSIAEASRVTGIPPTTIRGFCERNVNRKRYGKSIYNYRWSYGDGIRLRNNRKKLM